MTKQYNSKNYTIEGNPFAYYKRHWHDYYKNKFYQSKLISSYVSKIQNKELVKNLGIRIPETYYCGRFEDCPGYIKKKKNIIIKKQCGAGGSYKAEIKKDLRGFNVIVEECIRHFIKPEKFIIPFDYKIYMFKGRAVYVLVYNRNYQSNPRKPSFMLLDRMGNEVNNRLGLPTHRQMKDKKKVIPSKEMWNKLIQDAEHIGNTVFGEVFVRLDFYMDKVGPVFGELSPNPCGTFVVKFHEKDEVLYHETRKLLAII